MGGVTVSRSIVKWFEGKEMALAMGIEMAVARLGVFAVFWLSPMIAEILRMVETYVGYNRELRQYHIGTV